MGAGVPKGSDDVLRTEDRNGLAAHGVARWPALSAAGQLIRMTTGDFRPVLPLTSAPNSCLGPIRPPPGDAAPADDTEATVTTIIDSPTPDRAMAPRILFVFLTAPSSRAGSFGSIVSLVQRAGSPERRQRQVLTPAGTYAR
jgi:hypothetical protein